ncbi:hypothetical protein [Daejeonella lutea]|uniref:Uncharacterized protein n=1 Tax=Daejeonella lutea TaxID=572036 RepID=A0A1T5A6T7_9SPHI|nr:hypothetical protein [Daejeonella lutea]SKB30640.1 hypothetical protein SAMN05661099_0390 [Daejeonella lutea]
MSKIDETEQMVDLLPSSGLQGNLAAKTYNSGFPEAHDTYNALSAASDGRIYYVLSSDQLEIAGRMYVYDPVSDKTELLADLADICGEKHLKVIPQGKSHTRFYECKGKLFFSTHVGYYELIDGMDRLPVNPPSGYGLYRGGHILSYDLTSGKFEDLAILPQGEGMVSMTMDCDRAHIYGISWPKGNFIHYDVNKNVLNNLGRISGNGEGGTPGKDFRSLCRSLLVNPNTGLVYFSTSEGDIFYYDKDSIQINKVQDVNLRLDYFGKYDPTLPGSMGYNWRKIFWYKPENAAYGVHGNSGYLFKFEPGKSKLEIVRRITSELSMKSGLFDQFSYGYLGFQLGHDGETIYYLTGGPIYVNGKRITGVESIAKGAARGLENLHLITFNIPHKQYTDHGPIFYINGERPTYVNSIAIGLDGAIYSLARVTENNHTRTDLIKIENPFVENR